VSGHRLRPIRSSDVDIDHLAVMGSRERLWQRHGELWGRPPATLTHEEDKRDRARHEARALQAFVVEWLRERWGAPCNRYARAPAQCDLGNLTRPGFHVQNSTSSRGSNVSNRREADSFMTTESALARLISSLPASAVFVVDPQLRYVFAGGEALARAGIESPPVVGRSMRDVLGPELAAVYEPRVRAALEGEPFVQEHESDGRIYVSRGAPFRDSTDRLAGVLILAHDVTERRRTWLAARDRLGLQAFLFELGNRLRRLEDTEAIELEAARLLGERLRVARVGYAEDCGDGETVRIARNHTDGVAGIEGRHGYRDYGAGLHGALEAGRTVVHPDLPNAPGLTAAERRAHEALEIRASVTVPLVKAGALVALLFVHHREPRTWSEAEVALIEAVADQTWATVERARAEAALRYERARAQLALDAAAMGSFVWYADEDRAEADERMLALFGLAPGDALTLADALAQLIHEEDRDRYGAAVARALDPAGEGELREDVRVTQPGGGERWLTIVGRTSFAGEPPRAVTIAGAAVDVTEQRRAREQEHEVAVGLQRALLPDRLVDHADVPIAARYAAGSDGLEVGGDWYDAFALPDGRIGVCVGDVVGHGLEAAAAMGRLRVALATLATREVDPGRVLSALDEIAAGPNGARFLTVCYCILDPATCELRYASAGHPPTIAVTPAGDVRWLDKGRSPPICGRPLQCRPHASVTLEPGELLVLYSDGLVERRGEVIDRGLARLELATVRVRDAGVEAICDALIEELGGSSGGTDDIVVVCLRAPAGAVGSG
jgi:PAS domain-containing protein